MNELCRQTQESFGEPVLPVELARHLSSCEACQTFWRNEETLDTVLTEWRTPDFSRDFELAVMSRIAEETSRKTTLLEWLWESVRVRVSIPLPVGAMAAAVLVLSLALNLFFWSQTPGQTDLGGRYGITGTIRPVADGYPATGNGSVTIPREWLEAGAFLVIPPVESSREDRAQPAATPRAQLASEEVFGI